jgi:hypothetical protein
VEATICQLLQQQEQRRESMQRTHWQAQSSESDVAALRSLSGAVVIF